MLSFATGRRLSTGGVTRRKKSLDVPKLSVLHYGGVHCINKNIHQKQVKHAIGGTISINNECRRGIKFWK